MLSLLFLNIFPLGNRSKKEKERELLTMIPFHKQKLKSTGGTSKFFPLNLDTQLVKPPDSNRVSYIFFYTFSSEMWGFLAIYFGLGEIFSFVKIFTFFLLFLQSRGNTSLKEEPD